MTSHGSSVRPMERQGKVERMVLKYQYLMLRRTLRYTELNYAIAEVRCAYGSNMTLV